MDKIQKAIAKLPEKYKVLYFFFEERLLARNFVGLNIGKLKGSKNIYRLKHGRLRIIFSFSNESLEILEVGLRDGNTYKKY